MHTSIPVFQDLGLLGIITDPIHTPVTLFWPSDRALEALPPEQQDFLFNQDNKDKLKEYLKFHVIRDSKVAHFRDSKVAHFHTDVSMGMPGARGQGSMGPRNSQSVDPHVHGVRTPERPLPHQLTLSQAQPSTPLPSLQMVPGTPLPCGPAACLSPCPSSQGRWLLARLPEFVPGAHPRSRAASAGAMSGWHLGRPLG